MKSTTSRSDVGGAMENCMFSAVIEIGITISAQLRATAMVAEPTAMAKRLARTMSTDG